jgi:beta-phosphoglucomutase
MLQAVIFDMDGVIVDSHPAHRLAWRIFLGTLGKSVSDADLDFVLDGRKRSEILRHFLGELSDRDLCEYGKKKDEYFRKAALQVEPIPGLVRFIKTLRRAGIATAVATSASESRTRHTLEHLGLIGIMNVIVTGDDVVLGKPDPGVYRLACKRLQVSPKRGLAIEDAVSGIQSATGAGLNCIGVARHQPAEKLLAAGAVKVVKNFHGLSLSRLELCMTSQTVSSRNKRCGSLSRIPAINSRCAKGANSEDAEA